MDRAAALRRLKSCWRLAKSTNPNEAATALRHAQALMAEHGFSLRDVDDDAIHGAEAATRGRGAASPFHVWVLAATCASAFGCYVYEVQGGDRTLIRFVGRRSAPELAAYTFDVMRRQMQAGATAHVRRCRKRNAKASRSEAYGRGWVIAVRERLDVRDLPEEAAAEFKAFVAGEGTQLESKKIEARSANQRDTLKGLLDGRGAQLVPGVHGAATRQLEHAR